MSHTRCPDSAPRNDAQRKGKRSVHNLSSFRAVSARITYVNVITGGNYILDPFYQIEGKIMSSEQRLTSGPLQCIGPRGHVCSQQPTIITITTRQPAEDPSTTSEPVVEYSVSTENLEAFLV